MDCKSITELFALHTEILIVIVLSVNEKKETEFQIQSLYLFRMANR
jgi:hypothetical protein